MKLTYPAIFYPWDEGTGYTVEVPDLPGCVTEGDSLDEAILMGMDAASGWVLAELEDGKSAPPASKLDDIYTEEGGLVNMIEFYIDEYAVQCGGLQLSIRPA
jgi:predicted RNase H-like HicB family nuclease